MSSATRKLPSAYAGTQVLTVFTDVVVKVVNGAGDSSTNSGSNAQPTQTDSLDASSGSGVGRGGAARLVQHLLGASGGNAACSARGTGRTLVLPRTPANEEQGVCGSPAACARTRKCFHVRT